MGEKMVPFTNRWMFGRVVCNESVCRGLIRALLGIEAGEIDYLNAEQCYEPGLESRGVRMDVVAKADGRVYDIEMQLGDEPEIGRRMRYYQAALDAGEMERGDKYDLLPESHIVFICVGDPYRLGMPAYTFDRVCLEAPGLAAGDASRWHVLNARAWEVEPDAAVRAVLQYVRTGMATDALSREIDGLVSEYNRDRKWVGRVITFEQDTEMRCRWAEERGREEGLATGIERGEDRLGALVAKLISLGRSEDAARAAESREYRLRLYEELGL
ncbi:MAG: Rpn family recombination-promoting nuclease/putative transposase [Adlercreutzia sp.]|nr:Rpn family recombination-promoting nuclease/putative transposase [Adlercreutzia sp.]